MGLRTSRARKAAAFGREKPAELFYQQKQQSRQDCCYRIAQIGSLHQLFESVSLIQYRIDKIVVQRVQRHLGNPHGHQHDEEAGYEKKPEILLFFHLHLILFHPVA